MTLKRIEKTTTNRERGTASARQAQSKARHKNEKENTRQQQCRARNGLCQTSASTSMILKRRIKQQNKCRYDTTKNHKPNWIFLGQINKRIHIAFYACDVDKFSQQTN